MNWKTLLSLLLVISISGCVFEPSGPPNMAYVGEMNVTESGGFVMDGNVHLTWSQGRAEYELVTLCLYDDSSSLYLEEALGTIPPSQNVSVVSERVPKYVVVHSPDFYDESVSYFYYERTQTESGVVFAVTAIGHPSELPVDPRATGCGGS